MAKENELILVAAGECWLNQRLIEHDEKRFLDMLKIIRDADVAYFQFEVPILDEYPPGLQSRAWPNVLMWRRNIGSCAPIIADDLKWMGFDICSTPNNHSLDWSYEGIFSTIRHLNRVGFVHAGLGRNLGEACAPAYYDAKNARVALMAALTSGALRAMALDARRDMQGRPGVNPLRFETCYIVDEDTFENCRRYNEKFGLFTAPGTVYRPPTKEQLAKKELTITPDWGYHSAPRKWITVGDDLGRHTYPLKKDLERSIKTVKDARRQADLVLFSSHSHETEKHRNDSPEFIQIFDRALIDAGADMIVDSGHPIRGIEIYKGKPIFYSLGAFAMQNVSRVERFPQEDYEDMGLDINATPADYYDKYQRPPTGPGDGLLAQTKWEITPQPDGLPGSTLTEIKLYPLTMNNLNPRPRRGWPILADKEDAQRIIEFLTQLSAPFGTEIEFDKKQNIGIVKLAN